MPNDDVLQFVTASHDAFADTMVLDMLPDQFIGIHFWRIRRQEEQSGFAFRLADKLKYLARPVRRMTVNNKENRPFGIVQQALEKSDELAGIHSAFDSQKRISPRGPIASNAL